MTKKFNYSEKHAGDSLTHTEWNNLAQDVDSAVDAINNGSIGGEGTSNIICTNVTEQGGDPKLRVKIATGIEGFAGNSDAVSALEFTKKVKDNNYKGTNVSIVSNNNINIEPRESVGSTKGGNISLKPGDDIELCSHHRIEDNQNEVSVKVIDGDDNPVKLQINAASVTMTTKDKQGNDANVLDVNINSGKNTKGYLKVRAQAIDLRCEDHGGIALQPKGYDNDTPTPHMNKIKFEHGGGDGLEFATFNSEKTSIYTDEYRFKKDGVWKMATRTRILSDKYDGSDETTRYKYSKYADDFYDSINLYDKTATTRDIIHTAACFAETNNINFTGYQFAGGDFLDETVDDTANRKIVIALMHNIDTDYLSFSSISLYDLIYRLMEHHGSIYYGHMELLFNGDNPTDINDIVVEELTNESDFREFLFKNMNQIYLVVFDDLDDLSIITNSTNSLLLAVENYEYCFKLSVTNDTYNGVYIDLPSKSFVCSGKVVSIKDLIDLVYYFKTGAGLANGPWANL